MDHRDFSILAGFLLAAVIVRWLLFDLVGVWGDFGFYTYDARLIHQGETPFVDFLGRSPLFLYLYAAVVSLTGEYVRTLRWFAIFWYLATAVPVYLIGRKLFDRRVGAAALAFFLFTPFSIAFGVRASTQSMALFFSICGLYAVLHRQTSSWIALAGVLTGLGFLARQSMVALAGAVGLWLCWYGLRYDWSKKSLLARLSAFSAGWLGVVFIGYLFVVRDLAMAVELFNQQVVGLVATNGRGGLPLIGVEFPEIQTNKPPGYVPILNDVFPQLHSRAARVFAHTIMSGAPLIALLLFYLRDWEHRYVDSWLFPYAAGALIALAGYGIVHALRAGYYSRPLAVAAFLGIATLAWSTGPLERARLYSQEAVLLLFVGGCLSLGYLVRDRMVANYYFLDFWPVVALLAGVITVLAYDRLDNPRRVAIAGCLAILVVTSGVTAQPLAGPTVDNDESQWFTMTNIPEYQDDLEQKVDDGGVVFTGHPTYVAGTDVTMPMDDPRIHYRMSTFATEKGPQWPAAEMYDHVSPRLANGTYEYLILDTMSARMLQYALDYDLLDHSDLEYCRVESADDLYADTGSILYEHNAECPEDQQLHRDIMDTVAAAEYNGTA